MNEEKRVYFWVLKALGYCNRQMRVWCKEHNFSWKTLHTEGITAEELLSLDNSAMAQKAVDFAEKTGWSKEPIQPEGSGKSGGCV